jgi:hypothetical protein
MSMTRLLIHRRAVGGEGEGGGRFTADPEPNDWSLHGVGGYSSLASYKALLGHSAHTHIPSTESRPQTMMWNWR